MSYEVTRTISITWVPKAAEKNYDMEVNKIFRSCVTNSRGVWLLAQIDDALIGSFKTAEIPAFTGVTGSYCNIKEVDM